MRKFTEIDRAEWFKIGVAKRKILKSQLGLLEQLEEAMASAQENVSGSTPQHRSSRKNVNQEARRK